MKAKSTLIAVAALGAMALLGANASAGSGDGAQTAGAARVTMGDNFFSPTKLRVAPGRTVRWVNGGKTEHNVTFPGGFKSGNLGPGESSSRRFARAGKFAYSCTIHPGMNGKVKVIGG